MDGLTAYRQIEKATEYRSTVCMRFYSQRYWVEHGFCFLENIIHEDEDVGFLSLISAKRVEILDKRFYQRRYHVGSIMTSKTMLKSAQGYAGAFDSLLKTYSSIRPTGTLRDAYLSRMQEYMWAAADQYYHAGQEEKKQIRLSVQPSLRNGLKARLPVRKSLRVAELSLPLYGLLRSLKKRIMH